MSTAATDSRVQLGTLMCREGLLTEEQLQHALAVQESTGRPLGEVIVRLGYASAGAVANALAEQHGGTLRTEYGVSAGLGRPRADPPVPLLRAVPPGEGTQATQAPARDSGTAALEERARLAEQQVEQLEVRLSEVQRVAAEVTAARERAQAATREAEELRRRVFELEAELQVSQAQVAELNARLEAAKTSAQPDEEAHLVFVPGAAGYVLSRRDGRCPDVGAIVHEPEGAFVVTRVGPSPLGNRLRCAYLEPAP